MKYSKYIIGNSSAGIREAPYYGTPTINIGSRQKNRTSNEEIINCGYETDQILKAIKKAKIVKITKVDLFGDGNSDKLFYKILLNENIWRIDKQKQFKEMNNSNA